MIEALLVLLIVVVLLDAAIRLATGLWVWNRVRRPAVVLHVDARRQPEPTDDGD